MKNIIYIIILVLAACFCGCRPNSPPVFDSDPNSLGKYLGVPVPSSAKQIEMAATFDGEVVLLQAKFSISKDDFIQLASNLSMIKGTSAVISPAYNFRIYKPGDWWNPPNPETQWKIDERYSKNIPGRHFVMIWLDGIAYIDRFEPLK